VNFSLNYFFTAVSNDAPRWVRLAAGFGPTQFYVNGVRFLEGEYAWLLPGLYPVLVCAPLDWCNSWGHVPTQPRFVEIDSHETKTILAASRAEYAQRIRDWQFDLAEWKRLGGVDIACQKLFEASRLTMRMLVENAIGEGGFQAEVASYGNIASKPALHYAAPYRRMFGADLTPALDFEVFVPRKMFAHAYGADGRALAQEINSSTALDLDTFAAVLPAVPEAWQPAVLWGGTGTRIQPRFQESPPHPSSPPLGERVPEGRVRGNRAASKRHRTGTASSPTAPSTPSSTIRSTSKRNHRRASCR